MKLGILIEGQENLTWERWRHLAEIVERLGFESLWRSDHFMSNVDPRRDSLETWVTLAVTAAETTRLRFGPLVCPMSFRHPALLARMAVAVDRLSRGRLILGLGAGWNEREHRAFGLPFPPLRERLDRLEEGLEVIRLLLGDGPAYFAGREFQLEGADPYPKPFERPHQSTEASTAFDRAETELTTAPPIRGPRLPLLIGGGSSDRALRIVARYADEWDLPGGISPAAYRAKSDRLAEHCRAIGRDPREIHRSVSTAYLIGRDEAELRQRAYSLQQLRPDLAGLDPDSVLNSLRTNGWRVGTPAQLVAACQALADAGAERVVLQHNDQADDEALNLVATEVVPALSCYGGVQCA
jgi:alkanesulfonate monooxygenase SsuD/methylene tetrahydromethanopterin reductase-like flavin-dependent oxidoreductase (luciferase family)